MHLEAKNYIGIITGTFLPRAFCMETFCYAQQGQVLVALIGITLPVNEESYGVETFCTYYNIKEARPVQK